MTAELVPTQHREQSRAGSWIDLPRVRVRVYSEPMTDGGGDYHDFVDFGDGRLGFVLADVSSKGVPGAMLRAQLRAILRSQPAEVLGQPARLVAEVNRLFHDVTLRQYYASLFYGVYDSDADALVYVNCGHPAAAVCQPGGGVIRCESTGLPVGLLPDGEWHERAAPVRAGDRIVVCSDGIMDADVMLDDRTQIEIEVKAWIQ